MGADCDSVFAYPTIKYVKIQDARLGLFKYFLMFSILLYVVLVELAMNGGYLEQVAVTGACRFTLQQPTHDDCDPMDVACKNKFAPLSELNYCSQGGVNLSDVSGNIYPCRYYENIGAQQIFDKSIAVMTRGTEYIQELVCNTSDPHVDNCPFVYNQTEPPETFYVADAESFTILIDHSVVATQLDITKASSQLHGVIFVENNHKLCRSDPTARSDPRGHVESHTDEAPCYIKPETTNRNLDYVSLGTLLGAAGISLDDINYSGQTYRQTGATIILSINYDNFYEWTGVGDITYIYEPTVIEDSSWKFYKPFYDSYRQRRTTLNMHGISVEAVQGGTIKGFDFNNLLIQITTSLTLFAVATVIVDFVALYILPDKDVYEDYKYELTEDFSDRRQQMEASAAIRSTSGGTGPGGGGGVGSHMSMERGDGDLGPRGSSLGRAVVGDAGYSRLLADAEETSINTYREGSDETETSGYNADLLPGAGATQTHPHTGSTGGTPGKEKPSSVSALWGR